MPMQLVGAVLSKTLLYKGLHRPTAHRTEKGGSAHLDCSVIAAHLWLLKDGGVNVPRLEVEVFCNVVIKVTASVPATRCYKRLSD